MVSDHHEVGQFVPVVVKLLQAVGHDLGEFRSSQGAVAVACVQILMPSIRESSIEVVLDVQRQFGKFRTPDIG